MYSLGQTQGNENKSLTITAKFRTLTGATLVAHKDHSIACIAITEAKEFSHSTCGVNDLK